MKTEGRAARSPFRRTSGGDGEMQLRSVLGAQIFVYAAILRMLLHIWCLSLAVSRAFIITSGRAGELDKQAPRTSFHNNDSLLRACSELTAAKAQQPVTVVQHNRHAACRIEQTHDGRLGSLQRPAAYPLNDVPELPPLLLGPTVKSLWMPPRVTPLACVSSLCLPQLSSPLDIDHILSSSFPTTSARSWACLLENEPLA